MNGIILEVTFFTFAGKNGEISVLVLATNRHQKTFVIFAAAAEGCVKNRFSLFCPKDPNSLDVCAFSFYVSSPLPPFLTPFSSPPFPPFPPLRFTPPPSIVPPFTYPSQLGKRGWRGVPMYDLNDRCITTPSRAGEGRCWLLERFC